MLFTHLYLQSFRNYEELSLPLGEGLTLIYGENGQGKTNLLEALFLSHQGYSFRTRKLADCIPWQGASFVIRTEAKDQGRNHKMGLMYKRNGQKEISVDGSRSGKLSDLMGIWPVVAMGPADIELCQGAPGERRRFLDSNLCQVDPRYLDALRKYQSHLKHRNRLLKEGQEQLLDVYTLEIARLGLEIVKKRLAWLEILKPKVCFYYQEISGGREQIDLSLNSQLLKCLESENPMAAALEYYKQRLKRDLILKSTGSGIHKDEIDLWIQGHPLREFGSQGQQRSFSLALRLATADWLKDWKGRDPLVLLDDVFAELDPNRRERLLHFALGFRQVFLTAPDVKKDAFKVDHLLKITGGKVTF